MRTSPVIFISLMLLSGTAIARDEGVAPPLPDLTSFDLMRGDSGNAPAYVTVAQAADELKNYDVIFLGEWHDHAGNHLAEMHLFREIYAHAPQLALSMEQFERDVQPVVDDYMAGRIGEGVVTRRRVGDQEAVRLRVRVDLTEGEYLRHHEVEHDLSIRHVVGLLACESVIEPAAIDADAEKRHWAATDLHLADGPYKDKFMRFLAEDATHGAPASAADAAASNARAFAAQVVRDDTMAESIALYLQRNPGHKVVHITGDFHVEGRLGTVERLKDRMPALKIAVVVPVEAENPNRPAVAAADAKGGDFFFLMRGEPKEYANDAEKKAAEEQIRGNFRTRAQCRL